MKNSAASAGAVAVCCRRCCYIVCCCSCTSLWLLLAIVAVTASVGVAAVQILVLLLTVAGLFPIHLDSAVPCFQSTFANAVQFQSVLFFHFFSQRACHHLTN